MNDVRNLAFSLAKTLTIQPIGPTWSSPDGLPDNLPDLERAEDELLEAVSRARGTVEPGELLEELRRTVDEGVWNEWR